MPEDQSSAAELTDEQIESILDGGDTGSAEVPLTKPAATPSSTPQEYTLKINGKEIKAPLDKLTQWAQQGHDYGQRMQEFNAKQKEYDQKYGLYSQIDEFAKSNPDWWASVQESYNSRDSFGQKPDNAQNGQAVPNEFDAKFGALEKEIADLKKFKTDWHLSQESAAKAKSDDELKVQIESVGKQYSHIDLNELDESGQSLQKRVIDYAIENGIGNFKNAFLLLNHDRLLKHAETLGREKLSKGIQAKSKLGLLGTTPTPIKGLTQATDVRNKSYNELLEEALKEEGL